GLGHLTQREQVRNVLEPHVRAVGRRDEQSLRRNVSESNTGTHTVPPNLVVVGGLGGFVAHHALFALADEVFLLALAPLYILGTRALLARRRCLPIRFTRTLA